MKIKMSSVGTRLITVLEVVFNIVGVISEISRSKIIKINITLMKLILIDLDLFIILLNPHSTGFENLNDLLVFFNFIDNAVKVKRVKTNIFIIFIIILFYFLIGN